MDGCLVVYKPKGITSHDAVEKVRRAYGIRAGHAGTLDPMAQGVLVIFLGKALKLLQYLPAEALDKTYLMRVTLGVATDSYDATGKAVDVFSGSTEEISQDRILESLRKFVGIIDQKPPAFSAIKVGGKRAYDLARKGDAPDLASRKIHVMSNRLIKDYFDGNTRNLVLRVHCSRGTYMRSIAHDLGKELGCWGHLSYLLRERVGGWLFSSSFTTSKIEQKLPFENTPAFFPMENLLPFPRLTVFQKSEEKIRRGIALDPADIKGLAESEPPSRSMASTELCRKKAQKTQNSGLITGLSENGVSVPPNGENEVSIVQVMAENGKILALYKIDSESQGKIPGRIIPERVLS